MAMRLPRALTTLVTTAALLGGGLATAQAATAAPASSAPAAASLVRAGSLSASLTAAASAGASAGTVFSGRTAKVAPRVLPVLTTRARVVPLTPAPARPAPAPVAPVTPVAPAAPAVTEAQAYANEIVRLVNVQRASHGLGALRADSCATSRALAQSSLLLRIALLAHQDLNRVLSTCAARGAGENVGYGSVSAGALMTMWMNSPGHRANILSRGFTHIGVGAVKSSSGRWYGTQVFLTR